MAGEGAKPPLPYHRAVLRSGLLPQPKSHTMPKALTCTHRHIRSDGRTHAAEELILPDAFTWPDVRTQTDELIRMDALIRADVLMRKNALT